MALATVHARLDGLSVVARAGLVGGGYVAAFVVAVVAVVALVAVTSGPDRDASSGMHAFSDALFFLTVLSAGSVLPTGLLLYFMRAFATPWRLFAGLGLALSITGLLAAAAIAQPHLANDLWSILAVLRIVVAPLLAGLAALVGVFSPGRRSRNLLFSAAALECATSAYGVVHWLVPALLR
ncbi:MAG: hypothetical protein U0821_05895 [Chloroflexota bacterium]